MLNLPEKFIDRISYQFPNSKNDLIKALENDIRTSIRLNNKKNNYSPKLSPIKWSSNSYFLNKRPNFALDPLWHAGSYYVQEASSMFLEQAFKQIDNSKPRMILDLCAAPGGKSIHINSLIKSDDLLVSNELIKSRIPVLHENLTKWGFPNHIICNSDPKQFGNIGAMFDILLIDAPCSGEGLFRRDANAINQWSIDNTKLCEVRQRRILSDSLSCLKENGYLIYSTCTFNPGENEENIAWMCEKFGFETVRIPILTDWNIDEIEYQNTFSYRFLPHKVDGEGFFLSLLRKTSNDCKLQFSKKDKIIFTQAKDFPKDWLCSDNDYFIFQHKDQILFTQKRWVKEISLLQKKVNIMKFGTLLASCIKNKFNPGFELALSTKLNSNSFGKIELSQNDSLMFLAKENFHLNCLVKSWQLITFKDIPLGFVKGLENRCNNYYPKEWRLRTTQRNDLELWYENCN